MVKANKRINLANLEDDRELLIEAAVKHPIGLVQNEITDLLQREGVAALQMVGESGRWISKCCWRVNFR